MDYMDIDEDSVINSRDSIQTDSHDNKFADDKTNTVCPQEESTIVDSSEQNGHNKAPENLNSKASSISDRGKGIDCHSNSEPAKTVPERRVSARRRLVRNGCISPCNVAKAKESAEKNDSTGFGSRDWFSEANDSYRIMGKGVSNHSFSRKGPNSNFTSRNSNLGVQLGRSNGHHNAANTLHKRQNLAADSSNHGLRIMDPANEIDNFTPETRNDGSCNVGGSCSNDEESDFRAIQVEADEILARQLQEQLYNEVPAFGADEFDSRRGLAFQQEDVSHQSVLSQRRGDFRPRGLSWHREESLSSSSENHSVGRDGEEGRVPSSSIVARLRDRFLEQTSMMTSSSSSSSRMHSLFPSNMDVDMRIHILEALEAWSDMEMSGELHVDRDFNENDYEMLSALDENNCHFGATPARISELPLSKVESYNVEETCVICLETPTAGHTIRHLPCLHRFHKDCIDPWLRRRTSCPICKSSINATI